MAGEDVREQETPAAPAVMLSLLESAWDLIVSAGLGTAGWQEAAERWSDRYHALPGIADGSARQPGAPAQPLPDGEFVRVELPGYRQHTGWMTEETRAGAGVLVIRDWDGAVLAEVFPGGGSQIVHLPTPLKRPALVPPRAIAAGSDPDDDDDPDDDYRT